MIGFGISFAVNDMGSFTPPIAASAGATFTDIEKSKDLRFGLDAQTKENSSIQTFLVFLKF